MVASPRGHSSIQDGRGPRELQAVDLNLEWPTEQCGLDREYSLEYPLFYSISSFLIF